MIIPFGALCVQTQPFIDRWDVFFMFLALIGTFKVAVQKVFEVGGTEMENSTKMRTRLY